MSLKAKLISTVVSCFLLLGFLITGIWAATSGNVTFGGNVSFVANDVYAKITGSVSGANENVTLEELNYTATSEPTQDELGTWSNNALTFATKTSTIEISITVENLSDERAMYVDMVDNYGEIANLTKTLTKADDTYTSGSIVPIEPEQSITFKVALKITNPNKSLQEVRYGYQLHLNNDRPNVLVSSDESKGKILNYEVNGQKLNFEVQTEGNSQFVGFRNVDTGEYELLNVPNQAQVEALRLIGDYTFADAYMGEFVNSKAIYNVPPYYQAISSFPREEVVAHEQNVPGITAEFDRFVAKKDLYEVDYKSGTAYEAVFTSGGREVTENGFTYIVYEDAGLTMIKSYTLPAGSNGEVEIPKTLGGQPVKGMFINYDDTAVFNGNITKMTISAEMLNLGYRAFFECTTLENISLPDTLTKMEAEVFYMCSNLKSISIPNSVTSIGERAFKDCSSLTEISILDGVTSIGDWAFGYCIALESVTIGNGVTSIGDYAFYGCNSLTEITIPASVTSIGEYAFWGCIALESVTIGNGVTSIGEYAFYGCSSLTEISIPDSVTSIGERTFKDCSSLTEISIPDSVTSIGNAAFSGCSSLTEISIPDSVTSIGDFAFYGCSSLTEISIPDSVTSIGEGAFENCSSLTEISIPASVTSIGNSAFNGCSVLTNVTIEATTPPTFGINVFSDCNLLEVIKVPSGSVDKYKSADGWKNYANIITSI